MDVIERFRDWPQVDYRQLSPNELRTAREELRAAESDALATVDRIRDAAGGRALTSAQARDCDLATARMRDVIPILQSVEDALAERAIDLGQILPDGFGLDPFSRVVGSRHAYLPDAPLTRDQTVTGWAASQGRIEPGTEDLSLSRCLRGALLGDWHGAAAEKRAMSGASGSVGGFLLPTILSSNVIDLARNESVCFRAGARVFPMANRTVDVPKWVTDPQPAWRAESAAIAVSDGAIGKLTLVAKSLAVITKVSRELLEDSEPHIDDLLRTAFAKRFALTIDQVALYGTGANTPTGVKTTSGISTTVLTPNGLALTAYDPLVDAVATVATLNETPTAQIMAPRTEASLAKLHDTTNQPLVPPTYLDNIPRLSTNQVPTNLTVGTSNLTSDVFTADWRQLLVGMRTELIISQLNERYADTGEIGFIGWLRADIAVTRPAAFHVLSGVL